MSNDNDRFVSGANPVASGIRYNSEIIFSLAGPPSKGVVSGRYYPKATVTITGMLMSLDVVGTTATTINVMVNGNLLQALTIDPKATPPGTSPLFMGGFNTLIQANTDYVSVSIIAAGGGAKNIVIQVRTS